MAAVPLAVVAGPIVPQPGAQATPFCASVQVTPLLVPSFVTVAVSCCVPLMLTLAVPGETDTEIGRIRIDALPNAAVLVAEVAWRNMPTKKL